MQQAFDVAEDLLELATSVTNFPTRDQVVFKTIITTNEKSDENKVNSMEEEQREQFLAIKNRLMGKREEGGKALVIQLN